MSRHLVATPTCYVTAPTLLLTLSGELQSDNAVLKVRVNNMEQECEDEAQRMQDLLQENAQLELQKERTLV